MSQDRDGFLHPAGALTAREKNGLSAAPARPAEPLYPSNDPGEGRVPADWKSAASRPACSGHRPPLTPPRAMKKPTVSPAPARPAPSPEWMTEADWQSDRSGRLVRRERDAVSSKPKPPEEKRTEKPEEPSVSPVPSEAALLSEKTPNEEKPPEPITPEMNEPTAEKEAHWFADLLDPDAQALLEDPEDWPEDGEDALPDEQIPEPATVPVSLFPETRARRKWPWIAVGAAAVLTAGGVALWKTGIWNRLLERLP